MDQDRGRPLRGMSGRSREAQLRGAPNTRVGRTGPASGLASNELAPEARAAGRRFRVRHAKASDWYAARRVEEAVYGFDTLMEGSVPRSETIPTNAG